MLGFPSIWRTEFEVQQVTLLAHKSSSRGILIDMKSLVEIASHLICMWDENPSPHFRAIIGPSTSITHNKKGKREEEEGEVDLSQIWWVQTYCRQAIDWGLKRVWIGSKLGETILHLSTLIRLVGFGIDPVKYQICEVFCRLELMQFITE